MEKIITIPKYLSKEMPSLKNSYGTCFTPNLLESYKNSGISVCYHDAWELFNSLKECYTELPADLILYIISGNQEEFYKSIREKATVPAVGDLIRNFLIMYQKQESSLQKEISTYLNTVLVSAKGDLSTIPAYVIGYDEKCRLIFASKEGVPAQTIQNVTGLKVVACT